MISVLVLTHGNLARELLEAARRIDPQLEEASEALSLPWETDSDEASKQLKRLLRELGGDGGVLILTDMFGGTATNLALPLMEPERIEVITGVNLPMLVKLASLRNHDGGVHEVAVRLTEAGQKSIRTASEFLRKPA
jgi:PTS system mannose-specific IIA component